MNILVLNCGSSSLKYQLINMDDESVLAIGICERIGIEGSQIKHESAGKEKIVLKTEMKNHEDAVRYLIKALVDETHGCIQSMQEISAVGHRVVHGGEFFSDSVVIDEKVIEVIEECVELAPLHNPANLIGIRACQSIMPGVPMIAVFDTAFHQTMPEKAYLYAIPYEYYEKFKIRRYGFHGTSHKFVAHRAAEMLGRPIEELKIIVCHLGNGASVCAVDGGKSIDTSMGLTPLEGLVMGTRSGDIDPAIVDYIAQKENVSVHDVIEILNKKSGVLGLSGISSDFRDIRSAANQGDQHAIRTMEVFEYRVAKYIGSYAATLNGLDALVFTAGLGENNISVRANICKQLGYLGIDVDDELNDCSGIERDFSKKTATCHSMVVPTNEELMIARETLKLV
ncbi:acetate kinase [Vallitaleaceae bacterium 9-2]